MSFTSKFLSSISDPLLAPQTQEGTSWLLISLCALPTCLHPLTPLSSSSWPISWCQSFVTCSSWSKLWPHVQLLSLWTWKARWLHQYFSVLSLKWLTNHPFLSILSINDIIWNSNFSQCVIVASFFFCGFCFCFCFAHSLYLYTFWNKSDVMMM